MNASHIHIGIGDLDSALSWLDQVVGLAPLRIIPHKALFAFGNVMLVLDSELAEAPATIAFATGDCDGEFLRLTARGAVPMSEPRDYPWGVRSAYLKGPGQLTLEIEQTLGAPEARIRT